MISKETLEQAIRAAADAVRDRERELSSAQARLAEAERELKLLAELARLRGWMTEAVEQLHGIANASGNSSSGERRGRAQSPSRTSLLSAVVDILSERGEPMPIRDLMAAVQDRGVAIPGSGQQANLIAHITRDDRIARPRRGFYGLREWGLEDAKAGTRARRRRPRRRSGAQA
jgi:hypothetical protein